MSTAEHVTPLVPSRTVRRTDPPARSAFAAPAAGGVGRAAALVVLSAFAASAARGADVTVAFVGDQGHRENAEHLMERVRDGGVDLLVLGGDLGYGDDAEPWLEMMERALGTDFPVISVVGNHELYNWPQYRAWLAARIERVPELACDGDVGVRAHCRFRGLSIVQTAPGVHEVPGVDPDNDYAGYIRDEFADDPSAWRICSFHKNQTDMQIGNKSDATGWGVYEACREAGALVATAHEHSYSRTYLMSDFDALEVAHRDDHLVLEPGRSFAFVSGLGGHSPRGQARDGDWWASTYSLGDGATAGALFCTFSDRSADCRFEDISGAVPDRFTLESRVGTATSGSPDDDAAAAEGEGDDGESPADGEALAEPAPPADDGFAAGADASGTEPPSEGADVDGVPSDDAATSESSAAQDGSTTAEGATDDVAPVAPVATSGLMATPPPAPERDVAPVDGETSVAVPPADELPAPSDAAVSPPSGPTVAAPPPEPVRSPGTEGVSVAALDADDVSSTAPPDDDVSSAAPPEDGAGRDATGGGGAAGVATIVALLSLGGWRRRVARGRG